MDLTFLTDYLVLVIVGICLCVGYVIKSSVNQIDNKYIPLIMAVLGVVLNVWLTNTISPDVLLGGMFSGLSATGLHQMFANLINNRLDYTVIEVSDKNDETVRYRHKQGVDDDISFEDLRKLPIVDIEIKESTLYLYVKKY